MSTDMWNTDDEADAYAKGDADATRETLEFLRIYGYLGQEQFEKAWSELVDEGKKPDLPNTMVVITPDDPDELKEKLRESGWSPGDDGFWRKDAKG